MASKPTIEISFKQLATSLIQRSERGTAILLLNDSKESSKIYKTVADVDESLYSANNLKYIKNCMQYAPYELAVIASKGKSFSGFAPKITGIIKTGWIASAIEEKETVTRKVYNPGADINELGVSYVETGLWSNDSGLEMQAYNNTAFTKAAKIQKGSTNSMSINFTAPKRGKLTLIIAVHASNSSRQIGFDGKSIVLSSDTPTDNKVKTSTSSYWGYFKDIDIEEGEHSITRLAHDAYLFGMVFEYKDNQLQSDLASWIKSMELQGAAYKAVGTVPSQDCKHYVYFNQEGKNQAGDTVNATEYLPSLLGILASCNITKGCTNFLCKDLSEVNEIEDIDNAISRGQLVLTNDIGGVRIVTGINSLVTLNGNTATEDMQYIETVEAMDLIKDDIRAVFKNTYQGRFRNKYKYQMLFISSVNQYFSQLANEDILDNEYDNRAEIDVDEQRSAWLGTGKSEAEDWDDDKVKRMAFKRSVFIAGDIKILGSMENLRFTVTLV